ncbi:PLAT/LH2 domain-containing protein [Streptomyces sp. NPDC015232]|uniref:PLAT/LH2 domain-containing protein n=1 Tax=unclassified Streptomyces TaxID=2593676 RepID=UPI0036FAC4C2
MRSTRPLAFLIATGALGLGAVAPAPSAFAQAAAPGTSNVTIRVCDVAGAGTDDNVWGRLRDTGGAESMWVLFDKPGYNDFEAGDQDTYQVPTPDGFGKLKEIEIWKDGGNGLCLNHIQVAGDTWGVWSHSGNVVWWLDQVGDCAGDARAYCLGNNYSYPLTTR